MYAISIENTFVEARKKKKKKNVFVKFEATDIENMQPDKLNKEKRQEMKRGREEERDGDVEECAWCYLQFTWKTVGTTTKEETTTTK